MTNPYQTYLDLGYPNLLPIIPPDASISEGSSLFKRIGTKQDARGKVPGVKGRDGRWFSFDWINYTPDDKDFARWNTMGAGVGIRTGDGLVAIDADTTNEALAVLIRDAVIEMTGKTPVRVGRHPKALYVVRVSGAFKYQRIEFGQRDENDKLLERVEILSDGKQFVAEGVHPKTGKPYTWPRPLLPFADLPVVTPGDLTQLLERLRPLLPQASPVITEGAATTVSQKSLYGDLEMVRKAVDATPNTSALFPSRESYRDMLYAIKASLPDEPVEALSIAESWTDRWENGDNDRSTVHADWQRMKAPYRRGSSWLYEQAERLAPEKFAASSVWLDDLDDPENATALFASQNAQQSSDTFTVLSIDDIRNRPPAEWLIARHIPKKSTGFLYSVPGAGKSFLILDAALAVASGMDDWHGDALKLPDNAQVLYLAAEGSYGFKNRIDAWIKKNGRADQLAQSFRLIEQTINFMSPDDVAKLLRTVRTTMTGTVAMVVVDTVSRAMPGADENLQKDMTLFVRACDALRDATGGAIVGVHHAGKSGDMRGSTVLLGAGDFVFRLERKKGATVGMLACEKQKDGPDGWEEPYRFETVALGAGETSLAVSRADIGVGPGAELTPDTMAIVLGAIRSAWDSGSPWSMSPQSKERYAPRRMVADFGFSALDAEEALRMWQAMGVIQTDTVSARDKKKGLKVVGEPGQAVRDISVFD